MDLEAEARRQGRRLAVLVTRLRYLGDVILTTPVLAALKDRYGAADIHYCAERRYAEVLEGNPHLSGIIPLDAGFVGSLAAIRALRRERFVAAIDLFYNPRSAALLYLAGIPIRVGGSRRLRRRLYTNVFAPPPGARSAILHHVAALAPVDVEPREALPRVYLTAEEKSAGALLLEQRFGALSGGEMVVALHPGGTWPAKRWPPEHFGKLARLLRERFGARVCAITGPGEECIVRTVKEEAGDDLVVLPLERIRMVAATISAASAVVANDGGIMHMAVALGRPTVGIFGPTEPDIWFPYEGKGPFTVVTKRRPCAPCHRHSCEELGCLVEIRPEEVLARLEKVIAWKG